MQTKMYYKLGDLQALAAPTLSDSSKAKFMKFYRSNDNVDVLAGMIAQDYAF